MSDVTTSVATSAIETTLMTSRSVSMSAPPVVISEGENNVLRLFMVLRRTGPVATAMAQIYILLTKVGDAGVKDYCINTLGYSNRVYNSTFTAAERKEFEQSWDPLQMDVSILYKLLQRVCGLAVPTDAIWITPGETIEHMLYNAKNERNILAHEVVSLTKQNVFKTYAKLIVIFSTAFKKVSERTKLGLDQEKDTFIQTLDSIVNASISSPTWEKCQQYLKDAKEETLSKVIALARKDLHCLHDKMKLISPITWVMHIPQSKLKIDEIFTDLDMKKKDKAVKLEELLGLSQVVIVQGLNGSGKSVIARKLFHSWCINNHKIDKLDDCDIIVPIQCPYIRSRDLVTYLKEELLYQALCDIQYEEVVSTLQDARLIFIIDAWDEAASLAKNIVYESFAKFPSARFLITSRPEFAKDLQQDIDDHSHGLKVSDINIIGFNEENQNEYIKKMFLCMSQCSTLNQVESQESLNDFMTFLENKRSVLGKMVRLPLILSFLIVLWLENSQEVIKLSTTTQVYSLLLKMTQQRMVKRIRSHDGENRHTEELMHICNKWILSLAKEAWEALRMNQTYLTDNGSQNLMEECQRLDIKPMDAMSSLLQSETGGTSFNNILVWSFHHRTMQEFLAALHLLQRVNQSSEQLVQLFKNEESNHSPVSLIYSLCCGLACSRQTEQDIIEPHSDQSTEMNLMNVIIFLSALLTQEGKMSRFQAENILKVSKKFASNRNFIAKLIIECEENPFITNCIKSKKNHIKQFTSKDVTNILIISKYTICTFDKNLKINIHEVTKELIELIVTLLTSHNIIPNIMFYTVKVMNTTKFMLLQRITALSRNEFEIIFEIIQSNKEANIQHINTPVEKKTNALEMKKYELINILRDNISPVSSKDDCIGETEGFSDGSSLCHFDADGVDCSDSEDDMQDDSLKIYHANISKSLSPSPPPSPSPSPPPEYIGDMKLPPDLAQDLGCALKRGKLLFLDENDYDDDDISSDSDWDY